MSNQIEMISLEELVPKSHQYRKFIEVFDFAKIKHHLKSVEKATNYKGYGVDRLFRCLLLQFMENISDRELERMISKPKSAAARKNVHFAAIKKNNMRGKNRVLDRWVTGIRSPYEHVFSQQRRRVRYRGVAKNQFAEFMNAICFNMRRILVLKGVREILTFFTL